MGYVTRADDRCVEVRGAVVPPLAPADVAGLVARLGDGRAVLCTGVVMGLVSVGVHVFDEALDDATGDAPEGWEDVVEVSCRVASSPVTAVGPFEDVTDLRPRLDPVGAEWFRLRVHARHRDAAFDLVAGAPVEEYLLTSWAAPPSPARVLAAGSRLARRALARPAAVESPQDAARRAAADAGLLREVRRRRAGAPPVVVESPADAGRRAAAEANLLRVDRAAQEDATEV